MAKKVELNKGTMKMNQGTLKFLGEATRFLGESTEFVDGKGTQKHPAKPPQPKSPRFIE